MNSKNEKKTSHSKVELFSSNKKPLVSSDFVKKRFFTRRGNKNDVWIIGDKDVDKYILISEKKADLVEEIIRKFDGQTTLKEIEEHYLSEKNLDVNLEQLYNKLNKAGIIKNSKNYGQSTSEADLILDVVQVNPKRLLDTLGNFFLFSWSIWNVLFYISIAVTFFSLFFILFNAPDMLSTILEQNSLLKLFDSFIIGIIVTQFLGLFSMLLHEFGHYVMGKKLDLPTHGIILSFYGALLPMLRVDVRNIYLLDELERIKFWIVGICVNIFILTLSLNGIIFLNFIAENQLLQSLLWKLVIINFLIAIGNSIPFLPNDGYFIFSTILKKANLRTQFLKKVFRRDTSYQFSIGFWIYSIISIILLCIGIVLYLNWIISATLEFYNILPFSSSVNFVFSSLVPLIFIWQAYNGLKVLRDFVKEDTKLK